MDLLAPVTPMTHEPPPLIDILLAAYNGEAYLAQQLDSIVNQDFPDWRLIVRDDGSLDRTVDIIHDYAAKYPNKILLVPSGERKGPKGNFSALLHEASAPYIMFADQDDVWHTDKLTLSMKKMANMEREWGTAVPLLLHTDLRIIDGHNIHLSPSYMKYRALNPKHAESLNRLVMQNVVTGCTVLFNRRLLELAIPIPDAAIMHDWWVALVASAFGKIGYIESATIDYRQHATNTLGALKFSLFSLIKHLYQRPKTDHCARIDQAIAFAEAYKHLLPKNQLDPLLDFAHLPEKTLPRRILFKLRHDFRRVGFLRNAFYLLSKY